MIGLICPGCRHPRYCFRGNTGGEFIRPEMRADERLQAAEKHRWLSSCVWSFSQVFALPEHDHVEEETLI